MKIRNTLLIGVLVLLFFGSCNDKTTPEPEPSTFTPPGVFVVNEGNFTAGNASLTWFSFADSTFMPDAFYSVNKVPLGDVANFMTVSNGKGYIVVNNSGIVYVIDIKTGEFTGKISGLTSPREILILDSNTALISDLTDHYLTIADLTNYTIKGKIDLKGRTSESMVKSGNKVFVANWSKLNQQPVNDQVLVINTNTMTLTDSIRVTIEPNSMVVDKNNKLWVLCSGGYTNEITPSLYRINTNDNSIEQQFDFPDKNSNPVSLNINGSGDRLYFINDNIYTLPVSSATLPDEAWVSSNGNNFYTLGVRPDKEEIFVSDALDYVRNGKVFIYDNNGNLSGSFEAGLIPGYFAFVEE